MLSHATGLKWTGYKVTPKGSGGQYYWSYSDEYPDWGTEGTDYFVTTASATYEGDTLENYSYTADGQLAEVSTAVQAGTASYQTIVATGGAPSGAGSVTTRIGRDALGRITHYREYGPGSTSFERTSIAYDRANRETGETSISTRSDGVYTTILTNTYSGGQLASQDQDNYKGGVDSAAADTYQSYSYSWWDGAIQSGISYDNDTAASNTPWTTTYAFDSSGHVTSATIADGQPRTANFVTDQAGMVIDRTETKNYGNTTSAGSPRGLHYMFGGVQIGTASNNGSDNTAYATSIATRLAVPPTSPGPFANGGATMSASYDFDQNYDAINGSSVGSTGGSYTAQGGETLASIAQSLWGDASLWYLLADANGMTGSTELMAGQTVTIPNKVINRHNTADTFRPYDPNEALGDNSPTDAAKPPKPKGNKCGTFGVILLIVVAAAVSVVTAGAAAAALTPGLSLAGGISSVLGLAGAASLGAGTLIAAGVAGAVVGSVVSQGLGLITGIQQGGFNWKAVALAGLTAAVSGGIGAIGQGGGKVASEVANKVASTASHVATNTVTSALSHIAETAGKFAVGALRSAAASVITQGIAKVTGLQDSFDWGGVASAAIGGGLASSVHLPGGRVVNSVAGRIAGVGASSLVTGTDFGDNLMHALPDIIGQTIGDLVARGIGRAVQNKQSPGELALLDLAEKSANRIPANAQMANPLASIAPEVIDVLKNVPGLTVEDGRVTVTDPVKLKSGYSTTIKRPNGGTDISLEIRPDGDYRKVDNFQYYLDTKPTDGTEDYGGVTVSYDRPGNSSPISFAFMVDGKVQLRTFFGLIPDVWAGGTQRLYGLGATVSYGPEPVAGRSFQQLAYENPRFAEALANTGGRIVTPQYLIDRPEYAAARARTAPRHPPFQTSSGPPQARKLRG